MCEKVKNMVDNRAIFVKNKIKGLVKVVNLFYTVITSNQVVALRARKSRTCVEVIGVQKVRSLIHSSLEDASIVVQRKQGRWQIVAVPRCMRYERRGETLCPGRSGIKYQQRKGGTSPYDGSSDDGTEKGELNHAIPSHTLQNASYRTQTDWLLFTCVGQLE